VGVTYSLRRLSAVLVFNLEDDYARLQAGHGFLRPLEPLEFFLVGRYSLTGNLVTFPSPLHMEVMRNPSGYHLFFDREVTKEHLKRRLFLTPGDYQVRVTSPYYQTAERRTTIPMPDLNTPSAANPDPVAAYTFRLQPSHAYPFADAYPLRIAPGANCASFAGQERRGQTLLRGSLHTFDGQPVAGAIVSVPGRPQSYATGENGDWVLWFPNSQPSGPITVRVQFPGGATVDVAGVCIVRGRETSLAETGLRGWVNRAGAGVEGATVSVSGQPQPTHTQSDGGWNYYFPLNFVGGNVTVIATLPSGGSLSQSAIVVPRGIVVVPTFQFP
jgi:hypothetical protein